ncbi:MAG: DUF1906 domain-containing protein [Propionibacteriaceae bacterium]|nr:DUF1906 domain-containing protein [Propionibacteriaceae bacterium]
MDFMVKQTQQWLNATYATAQGWIPLVEDGETGWNTIYGLRMGLQHELGISPVATGFGPATTSSFQTRIGRIDAATTSQNILRLLSGSLWCKGYYGAWNFTSPLTFAGDLSPEVQHIRSDLGFSSNQAYVDVKLMASLLSMDQYTTVSGGKNDIREVQQWLNATYSPRREFALVPCDGLFTRQIQTAMLYALQYEFGMDDDTANGNFGPGTRAGLQTQAIVKQGDSDASHHFVRLLQAALRLNGYGSAFDGGFNAGVAAQALAFQADMELPATGQGDYGTWCALLVSTGDPTRPVTGFDTATQLTSAQATAARTMGYSHIGRYTVGVGKFITAQELTGLKAAGLALFPIHQRFNNSDAVMTESQGKTQGTEALERCRVLGIPAGSVIFFAVDYDPSDDSIAGPVTDFFRGVNTALDSQLLGTYKVGVYGTRNVCTHMCQANLASAAFVAGMSTGWSGNMGFAMPKPWAYNQILETTKTLAGTPIDIDHTVVAKNAPAINLATITPPPTEKDGSTTDTGFDILFDWTVRAEAACERALKQKSQDTQIYAYDIPENILGWLRKPTYWSEGLSAALWHAYTPELPLSMGELSAKTTCEASLDERDDIRKSKAVKAQYRDIAHMAATALGYRIWGWDSAPNQSTIGDLGGWLLDLLQLWGQYARDFPSENLAPWLQSMVGKQDGYSPEEGGYYGNPASTFSYADVLADADAWLLAKTMDSQAHGLALSKAMRTIFQEDGNARIRRFYTERFGGNKLNVVSVFQEVATGFLVGHIDNLPIPLDMLRVAANAPSTPSVSQAQVCAGVYANFLANPLR